MEWTDAHGETFSLHGACYVGRLDAVNALLEAGADPNAEAPDDQGWISAAPHAKPLHCVAIAWEYTPAHAEIARLLISRGATVEDTVLDDYWIETTLTDEAIAVGVALGIDEADLRALRARHGAVDDRYDDGKVLFVPKT